jgi:hypothetical protein
MLLFFLRYHSFSFIDDLHKLLEKTDMLWGLVTGVPILEGRLLILTGTNL